MPFINSRTIPLTPSEIDDFFNSHLRYRLFMLNTHREREGDFQNDSAVLTCMFESSLIVSRVLMEFLGLGVDDSTLPPRLVPKTKYFSKDGINSNEVKVIDLKGKFVNLNHSLKPEEQEILAHVYLSGHKATAHLTLGGSFTPNANLVQPATEIIRRLLKENLEDVVNRKIA